MASPDQVARNLLLEHDLAAIVDRSNQRGIELIVLKGIPLALRLFARVDARAMVDNDLLVRRKDAASAFATLRDLGYESIDSRRVETQLDYDYEYRLSRALPAGGSVMAEIHWNITPQHLYPIDEEILWRHTEDFAWRDRRLRVFDRALTLVHLAAHFAQSDFASAQVLNDVAWAWNLWYAGQDCDAVLALAGETGLVHVLDFALSSADDLDLLRIAPPRIGSRRAKRLRSLLPAHRLCGPRPSPDYVRLMLGLLLAEPRRVPVYLWNLTFPPVENIAALEGGRPRRALLLRYLTRPLRPIRKLLDGRPESTP